MPDYSEKPLFNIYKYILESKDENWDLQLTWNLLAPNSQYLK